MRTSILPVGTDCGMISLLAFILLIGCGSRDPLEDGEMPTGQVEEPHDSIEAVSWVTDEVVDSVVAAIERAEAKGEVPIGAAVIVCTEQGRLIFSGENTLSSNGDAAGHAEINAIQRAIRWAGSADAFKRIPQDSLYLVSSLEPCPMCAGAIASIWKFRPDHVALFLPKRPLWRDRELAAVDALRAGYVATGLDSLQLAAFCRVPSYRTEYPEDCE